MNELAGITGVTLANLPSSKVPQEDAPMSEVHDPVVSGDVMVQDLVEEENLTGVPDLVDNDNDNSDSESGDSVDDQELGNDPELKELKRLLTKETDIEDKAEEMMRPPLRRSARSTAGMRKYDDQYEWNLLNLTHLVAGSRMQDRPAYTNHSSLTVKTRSVMTCLKLAVVKKWEITKIDIGGAYLCASMNDDKVFMMLDKSMTVFCERWLPNMKENLREDGKLIVKVDKAMYGLIQSAKLWYNKLSGFLMTKGFKKHPTDDSVFVKQMNNGKYLIALLYVDDLLVMSELQSDRDWVKDILKH
jgi:hypothetical protein